MSAGAGPVAVHARSARLVLEDAHPPDWHLTAATQSWLAQTSFPSSEYLAAIAAVLTVAGAWASRAEERLLHDATPQT